jgi:hypothetical protein
MRANMIIDGYTSKGISKIQTVSGRDRTGYRSHYKSNNSRLSNMSQSKSQLHFLSRMYFLVSRALADVQISIKGSCKMFPMV